MKRFALVLGLAVMALTASTARASIVYQYIATDQSGNVLNSTNFTLSSGVTSTVNIYMQETVSNGDKSFILAQSGLFSGAFQIHQTSGDAGMSAPTGQVGAGQGFANGNLVTVQVGSGNTSTWRLDETIALQATSGPTGTVDSTGAIRTVLLGSETFTGGTSTSTFTLTKQPSAGSNTNATNGSGGIGQSLDVNNTALNIQGAGDLPFTITINANTTATPEPGSMALCGLAASGFGFGAWRRRKARLAAEAAGLETPAV